MAYLKDCKSSERIIQETVDKREKAIKSPEEPFIHVCENRESNRFEAAFTFDLEGVLKNSAERERAEGSEKEQALEQHSDSLIDGILWDQSLDFIYNSGRNPQGLEHFGLRVKGFSREANKENAVEGARLLRQSLAVGFKRMGSEYRFAPVASESVRRTTETWGWIYHLKPAGIALGGRARRQVGFLSENGASGEGATVIVPYAALKPSKNLDSVLVGAMACPAPVKVVVSISRFRLTADEIKDAAVAYNWLKNGEGKSIRFLEACDEGVEDAKLLSDLRNTLKPWLRSPMGYRLSCAAMSKEPLPRSFIKLLGGELFHGCPYTVDVIGRERFCSDSGTYARGGRTLDLRGCVSTASALPPLFPEAKKLLEHGVRRVYSQPALKLPSTGIVLGETGETASSREVRLARADRSRHCYVVGATGTGKSTLLYNMIVQDIENGEGVAVIDPHGDLYQQLLESIPRQRAKDVVLVDPCDYSHSVGINFLECNGTNRRVLTNFVVNEWIRIFDRLYDLRQTGGPMFEQYMRNAMLLAIEGDYSGATLMDVPRIFEDRKFRDFLLDKCSNPTVVSFWRDQAEEAGGEASLKNLAPYVTSKLNQFTTNGLLRPIIGQHRSTVDFRELIDNGKILLVNLSKGLLGQLDSQLLGMLVMGKIFTAAMSRAASRTEYRKPVFLYVDEFQNFTTDTVAHLLSEARKFGLYLTLANQNLAQLSANQGRQNILDAVLGNVGTMLIFRLGAPDAEKIQIYTRPELDAQDLQDLPDFHMAARLLVNNCPSRPFVSHTLPARKVARPADAKEIVKESRRKYTLPTEQVEKDIISRRDLYKLNSEKPEEEEQAHSFEEASIIE